MRVNGFIIRKKLRNIWSKASIKSKILLFMFSVTLTTVGLVGFSFYQSTQYINNYNELLDAYYNTNNFINTLEKANSELEKYIVHNDLQAINSYNEYYIMLKQQINLFNTDVEVVGKERCLLARAIKNSYETYNHRVGKILDSQREKTGYIQYRDEIKPVYNYVQLYLKQLLGVSLSNGQSLYIVTKNRFDTIKIIALILSILFLIFTILFAVILIKHIVNPILNLSKASIEISKEKFDGKDVYAPNNDEIFELVKAFNKMKHRMHNVIDTLKEKNEIEKMLLTQKLEAINTQKLIEQAKMKQLQSQVNPHFLFNTLNTISRMSRIENAKETELLISSLSKLFRYTLQTENTEVPLQREISIINEYMHIQKIRFGRRIEMQWEIDEKVDTYTIHIPSFTLQPIIENSIIHGIEPKIEGGLIRVKIYQYNDNIIIVIIDNGVGMDKQTLINLLSNNNKNGHISGIGVNNVLSRLKLLYKDSKFIMRSKLNVGTIATIKIPLKKEDKYV